MGRAGPCALVGSMYAYQALPRPDGRKRRGRWGPGASCAPVQNSQESKNSKLIPGGLSYHCEVTFVNIPYVRAAKLDFNF